MYRQLVVNSALMSDVLFLVVILLLGIETSLVPNMETELKFRL